MKLWERIKRLWAPAPPDYPLTEEQRDQVASNRYGTVADAAATILSHGDPNITGRRVSRRAPV
jgi:hypothetical protein